MKLDLMSTFFLLSKNSFVILWKDVWNPPKLLHSSIYPRKLVGGFFQDRQQFCRKPQSAEVLECAITFGNIQKTWKFFFSSFGRWNISNSSTWRLIDVPAYWDKASGSSRSSFRTSSRGILHHIPLFYLALLSARKCHWLSSWWFLLLLK